MIQNVYWYDRTIPEPTPRLRGALEVDTVVVGGGIAGLAAAQWLRRMGCADIVLLEARICGAGATGRSSGFITPDSELQLSELTRRFGDRDAALLWGAAAEGCAGIARTIQEYGIACDYFPADSFFAAASPTDYDEIEREHGARQRLGLPSRLYAPGATGQVLGGAYYGGVRYGGTFAIDGFAFAQGMKRGLIREGVRVFEHSAVLEISSGRVRTAEGSVTASRVILCLDRYGPQLGIARDSCYHVQTFLMMSEPLDDRIRTAIFPDWPLLVWDTDLIYPYFRLTGEGRLLVGGGLLRETYRRGEQDPRAVARHLLGFVRRRFPQLCGVSFPYGWPGRIGVTQDLLPLAGQSPDEPSHYYAMCGAGLPWSVLAGRVAAESALLGRTEFDRFFSPARATTPLESLQPLLGRPLTFALSHLLAKRSYRGLSPIVPGKRGRLRAAFGVLGAALEAGFWRLVRPRRSIRRPYRP
jgi:gamma-glutamylputrescine oxidase